MCVCVLEPGTMHRVPRQSSYCVREVPVYFTLIQDYSSWHPVTISPDFSYMYYMYHWFFSLQSLLSCFLFTLLECLSSSTIRLILSKNPPGLWVIPPINGVGSTLEESIQSPQKHFFMLLNAQSFIVTLSTPRMSNDQSTKNFSLRNSKII